MSTPGSHRPHTAQLPAARLPAALALAALLTSSLTGCTHGPMEQRDYHPADKDTSVHSLPYAATEISISQLQSFQQRLGEWNQRYHQQLDALHKQQILQVHHRGMRLHALRDDNTLSLEQHNLLQALAYQAHQKDPATLPHQQTLVKQFMALEVRRLIKALAWAEQPQQRHHLATRLLALHDGDYEQPLHDVILGFEPETGRPQPPQLQYPAVPPADDINRSVNMVNLMDDYERTMIERSQYLDRLSDYLNQPMAYSRLNPDQAFRTQVLEYELAQANISEQDFFSWAE